jgi:hypothetical protein
MRVPDIDTAATISLQRLRREFAWLWTSAELDEEVDLLVSQKFLARRGTTRLQRLNGWAPLHTTLVAIELKLGRIEEAFHQATTHLAFTPTTYVGLPEATALRVARGTWRARFRENGIGLLAVGAQSCRVLFRPGKKSEHVDAAMTVYMAEKFWPEWLKDSSS